MTRFQHILVTMDRDPAPEAVLAQAERLARAAGAKITLLSVIEDLPWYARLGFPPADDIQALVAGHRGEAIAKAAAGLKARGIRADAVVVRGRPHDETVREAIRGDVDLVIKAADPVAPVSATTGDMRLLRNCPCPVLLLRPGQGASPFATVLATVDPTPPEDATDALGLRTEFDDRDPTLDRKVLDLASTFVAPEGTLHVLHAWGVPGEDLLRSETLLSADQVDAYVENAESTARASLDRLLGATPPPAATRRVHLVKGTVDEEIAAFADREKVELVVMGTVARVGFHAFLMGNTAETILSRVGCSILAVKPEGFASPIKA